MESPPTGSGPARSFGAQAIDDHGTEKREHDFVVACERVAFAAAPCRAVDDVHARTVMLNHVEVGSREAAGLVPDVAGDGERLEKHFGQNDRRADIHDHASSLKILDDPAELLEVPKAQFTR